MPAIQSTTPLARAMRSAAALLLAGSLTACASPAGDPGPPPAGAEATGTTVAPPRDPVADLDVDPAFREARPAPYAWAEENALIAHGMGGIGTDKRVTNSFEAFVTNYEAGYRIFEVDLVFSADRKLVARHDWEAYMYEFLGQTTENPNKPMTEAEFEAMPIHGSYSPLTIADIITIMKAYPDVYIMTDTKSAQAPEVTEAMEQIVAAMGEDTVLADRLIIQIYNDEMLATVRTVYDFKNIVYTVYQLKPEQIDPAIRFAADNGVRVLTYPDTLATPEFVEKVSGFGLLSAVHTINDPAVAGDLIASGVKLVYSDFLVP